MDMDKMLDIDAMGISVDVTLEYLLRHVESVWYGGIEEHLVEGTLHAFCGEFLALNKAMLSGDVPTLWRNRGPE